MKLGKKYLKTEPLSMRGKKRYVLFQIFSEKKLPQPAVNEEFESLFLGLFGEKGFADQRYKLIEFDPASGNGVLRSSLECAEQSKAGLLFLQKIQGFPAFCRILAVSGSLAKLRQ